MFRETVDTRIHYELGETLFIYNIRGRQTIPDVRTKRDLSTYTILTEPRRFLGPTGVKVIRSLNDKS